MNMGPDRKYHHTPPERTRDQSGSDIIPPVNRQTGLKILPSPNFVGRRFESQLCEGDFEHGVRNIPCTSGHLFSTMMYKASGHVIQWSDFRPLYFTRLIGHIVCSYLCMMQVTNCSPPNMSMFRFLVAKRITLSRASQMARFGLYS